jgi:hypothetical protein
MNDQNQAQQQREILVKELADGAWLLVRGMRLWKKAFAQGACISAVTYDDFSAHNCEASVRYLDEIMCLFQVASHRSMVINSVTAEDTTEDELRIVAMLRLIEGNRFEKASLQLLDLVRGPLNLSIIRACADLACSFKKQKLVFSQKPHMALTKS